MKTLFLAATLVALTGCSATMETALHKGVPNAPVNEINGGVISYLNAGAQAVRNARRQDAYNKMHDFCEGPYRVTEENERPLGVVSTPFGNTTYYSQDNHTRIRFECVRT